MADTFCTVWQQDFKKSDRLPVAAVNELMAVDAVVWGYKPNRKGKLKPVLIILGIAPKFRDDSAQMGPRVIEGNAMGRQQCKAIVAEWGRTRLRFA